MTSLSGLFVPAVLILVAAAAIVWFVQQRLEKHAAALRQEMQSAASLQAQTLGQQITQLSQNVTQQLGQVRQELQSGVAATGKLATEAQREVAQRLEFSTEAMRRMSQQLGEVQKSGQDLSQATQTLQQVLGGVKTRGTLGEIALERLLEDSLPRAAYETQYRFATGEIVDAVVRAGERLLPIDSKFPLEAYRRMMETGEDARKEFVQAVRKHAESIASKYILPGQGTLDVALMFVPSEGVYYELLMTEEPKAGRLDEYCRRLGVLPVSPNSLHAYLASILIGIRGMQMAENIRHIRDGLAGLEKQLEGFAEVYEKLGTHLRHAQQSYEEADSKLTRTRNALEQMAQGALPDAAAKVLEASSRE